MSDQSAHQVSSSDVSGKASPASMSPPVSPGGAMPFRLPMRRTRTVSESERIQAGPQFSGQISSFCREKGHGFVKPSDGSELLFVHISDVEGDWVPKEGDDVVFKRCLVPPKNEKYAAVHVQIVHKVAGKVHEKWDKEGFMKPDILEGDG